MKKVIKKKVKSVKVSKKMPEEIENVASSKDVCKNYSIDKLAVSFQNEDMNKVVEKINEIIEKI